MARGNESEGPPVRRRSADAVPGAPRDLLEELACIGFEADAQTLSMTYVSRGAEEILGYPVEAWYDPPSFWLERVVHPEDRQEVVETVREHVRAGRDHEVLYRAVRADGNPVWLRAAIRLEKDAHGAVRHVRGFMIDVTEARQTEERLRKSEERLHLALDAASMGVWDWDVPRSMVYWSDQVYRLHDVAEEQFDGTFESYMHLVDRIHPDDADDAQAVIRTALQTGDDYGIEYRVRHADGENRWLFAKGRIYFDEAGDPMRVSGTVHDITARKEAEAALRELTETLERRVRERTADLERANRRLKAEIRERSRAEEALERANRALRQSNRELQDFAYVASHDLQEPLRKIITFAGLLRSEFEAQIDDAALSYVGRMEDAGQRMRALIHGLLEYSRVKTKGQPFRQTDLGEVARRVLEDLEIRLEEVGGRVEIGDLPSIEADPMQMRQLFQNLIGNALKYHRANVPPVVAVRAAKPPGGYDDSPGAVCRITVEDNGIGFEEQYAERIFAPFQRLHGRSAYEGTGMGLAICRRIVERHHGTIEALSTLGEGSTFVVSLPVYQAELREGVPQEVEADRDGHDV